MAEASSPPRVLSWLRLLRLPNVFTAVADVMMGYLVTHEGLQPGPVAGLLIAGSASLYLAGMVWNDVCDFEIDARERPGRPLPSGQISQDAARRVGVLLLVGGATAAGMSGWLAGTHLPGMVAVALVAAILLYDMGLKKTAVGPLAMGACRTLNVLLGMSAALPGWGAIAAPQWLIAVGLGLYIAGVTWFAKGEATTSGRAGLAWGMLVMALGLVTLAAYPYLDRGLYGELAPPRFFHPSRWPMLWACLGFLLAGRCLGAIAQPTPRRVQYAVKNSILSLIVIDAVIVSSFRGLPWAVVILVLLLPALALGKWVYST